MKKETRVKPDQVALLNGCYRSQFAVHPKNWNDTGASVKELWYFSYRYYDPRFNDHPKLNKGKQRVIKGGVNEYKTLMERRQIMKMLLEMEKEELDVKGFNPITMSYMEAPKDPGLTEHVVHPDTPFIEAMKLSLNLIDTTPQVRTDIRSVLKYIAKAADRLKFTVLPVSQIKLSHVRLMLAECGKIKGEKWTNNNFNYHRKYLRSLFEELIGQGTLELNPVDKVPTKKIIKRKRQILTDEERAAVSNYLQEKDYNMWRLMNIFYEAGCRTTEIFMVQANGVDLINQSFKAIIKKGKTYREADYTISDNALKYWQEIMAEVQYPDDYIFSKGLKPGAVPISPKQITRRWRKKIKGLLSAQRIKDGLSPITVDWYSLKHLHTTHIVSALGIKAAADFNNESENMIRQHYDVLADERKHKEKKKINIPFVPVLR